MELKSILEAMLFVHGDPLALEQLAELAECRVEDARAALQNLGEEYQRRGLILLQKDNTFQIGSHPDAHTYIENLMRGELSETLSRSALETIAIVAYKGPLARAEIDYIRGVNSSYTLRNLLMRGLIERAECTDATRGYRYQISFQFLQHFGLAKIEDLPDYGNIHSVAIELAEDRDDHIQTDVIPVPTRRDGNDRTSHKSS